jgi:hypothetical protein
MPVIPALVGGLKIGRSWSRWAWAKSETLSQKISKAKRAGDVAQAVEHLPCKPVETPELKKKQKGERCLIDTER